MKDADVQPRCIGEKAPADSSATDFFNFSCYY